MSEQTRPEELPPGTPHEEMGYRPADPAITARIEKLRVDETRRQAIAAARAAIARIGQTQPESPPSPESPA